MKATQKIVRNMAVQGIILRQVRDHLQLNLSPLFLFLLSAGRSTNTCGFSASMRKRIIKQ